MGEINLIQKNRSKKKWGREEWIILILAGVFLLIVFMPSFENDKKDNDFEKEQEQRSIKNPCPCMLFEYVTDYSFNSLTLR